MHTHKREDHDHSLVFDTHAHLDTRPFEDFELMGIAGVTDVLTLAHDPMRMSTADVLLDHFHKLVHDEVRRGAENGISVHVGLGVHPRAINAQVDETLRVLPKYLSHPDVVAVGEIGLERCTEVEERVFRAQLEIEYYPKVIHTPRRGKRQALERIVAIIDDTGIKDVVIDHVDLATIDIALEAGTYVGITVQPGKSSVEDAVQLIEEYPEAKFVVNSDMSSQRSDCLSVARVLHALRLEGYADRGEKACVQNGLKLFLR
jgi:predicted metal-dependent TIM-barrel fold hydrolase